MCATAKISLGLIALVVLVSQCSGSSFFGANYHTDDGQYRHEVFDGRGGVSGSYSNVFPSGQMILVKYNAGQHSTSFGTAGHIPQQAVQYYTPQTESPFQTTRSSFVNNIFHGSNQGYWNNNFQTQNFPSQRFFAQNPSSQIEVKQNEIPPAESLFTPASEPFPAETSKQIEAFNKALEEEAQEALQALTTESSSTAFVNFNLGNTGFKYQI